MQNWVSVSPGQLHRPWPHTLGLTQLPHEATVRNWPQLSVPERPPQLVPVRVQNCASLSGVQPHWLAAPPPPHVWAPVQVPQLTVRLAPQLSMVVTPPQRAPTRVHSAALDSGWQVQVKLVEQTLPLAHAPQLLTKRDAPQRSMVLSEPHARPAAVHSSRSVCAVQLTPPPAPPPDAPPAVPPAVPPALPPAVPPAAPPAAPPAPPPEPPAAQRPAEHT